MEQFTEKNQVDYLFGNSSGITAVSYYWPNIDMGNYDEAVFVISAPFLQMATATAAANECILQSAVYAATAATSTSLTAISSATASFGSTSGGQINKAKSLIVTFNTASTGTTYSINGRGSGSHRTTAPLVCVASWVIPPAIASRVPASGSIEFICMIKPANPHRYWFSWVVPCPLLALRFPF